MSETATTAMRRGPNQPITIGEQQIKKYRLSDGDVVSRGVHELVYHDLRSNDDTIADYLERQRVIDYAMYARYRGKITMK